MDKKLQEIQSQLASTLLSNIDDDLLKEHQHQSQQHQPQSSFSTPILPHRELRDRYTSLRHDLDQEFKHQIDLEKSREQVGKEKVG